jgi:hypothetical protein
VTDTEIALIAAHRTPVIPLDAICKEQFNLSPEEARRAAALHRLPVPAFKLRDSARAPFVVKAKDLAAHIDSQAEEASRAWERSQL